MDDQRLGAAVRTLRLRRGWRQLDVAAASRVSRATVSRLERGYIQELTLDRLRRVAGALDARATIDLQWRGGQLARLLDQRHAAMENAVAAMLSGAGWEVSAEVSYSIYGERGAIDVMAWWPAQRALLIVEVKPDLLDLQDTLGVLDRKRRLGPVVARQRGLEPRSVSTWLLLSEGRGNRRRVDNHADLLRAVLPAGAVEMRRWLRRPDGPVQGLSFLAIERLVNTKRPGRSCRALARARGAQADASRQAGRAGVVAPHEIPPGVLDGQVRDRVAGRARR